MTFHRPVSAFLATAIAMLAMAPSASAALLFFSIGIGDPIVGTPQEGEVDIPTLTEGSEETLSIFVRDGGSGSTGGFLHTFGFRLKVEDPGFVKITEATLNLPNAAYSGPEALVAAGGQSATAKGQYLSSTRPVIASAQGALLATFKIQGIGTGSTSITIEELSAGNNDFQSTDGNPDPNFAERDRRTSDLFDTSSFADPASDTDGFGDASTFASVTSTVTAVPEPASSALVAGGLAVAFMARWRRRKQARAASPA